jgi:hypothetical protein
VSSAVALTSPAWGDTLTATRPSLSEATRAPTKAGPLPPGEQAVVDTFERLTCCVVNVVDITVAQGGMSSRVGAQVRAVAWLFCWRELFSPFVHVSTLWHTGGRA